MVEVRWNEHDLQDEDRGELSWSRFEYLLCRILFYWIRYNFMRQRIVPIGETKIYLSSENPTNLLLWGSVFTWDLVKILTGLRRRSGMRSWRHIWRSGKLPHSGVFGKQMRYNAHQTRMKNCTTSSRHFFWVTWSWSWWRQCWWRCGKHEPHRFMLFFAFI